MSDRAFAIVHVLAVWWASTGIILWMVWLGRASVRPSVALTSVLAAGGVAGLAVFSRVESTTGAYVGFASAVLVWAWHELVFLLGAVTGPRKVACPREVTGFRRFVLATSVVIHHELALAATVALIVGLTWSQPNQVGTWTFLVLWVMRLSAKLNVFLGVRNLNEQFVPPHLRYITSYFRRAKLNALMPFSLLAGSAVVVALVLPSCSPDASPFVIVSRTLVASMLALAVLEHVFLALPIPDAMLWRWAIPSGPRDVVDRVVPEPPATPLLRTGVKATLRSRTMTSRAYEEKKNSRDRQKESLTRRIPSARQQKNDRQLSLTIDLPAIRTATLSEAEVVAMAKSSTKLGSEPSLLGKNVLSLVGLGRTDRKHLLETIEQRLIPELALAHLEDAILSSACADVRGPPTDEEVAILARIAVARDVPAALKFIETIASAGVSLEVILLQLLAPAARLLGDQWLEDDATFMEVTEGLSTIQQVVHILGPSFAPDASHRGFVVLTTSPLEQHTLGVFLVGEFLRRAGWGVQVAPRMSLTSLVDVVQQDRVEAVGISVTNGELFEPVMRMVRAARDATINPDMSVMLGGAPEVADYARELGVTYCSDANAAVQWLDERYAS